MSSDGLSATAIRSIMKEIKELIQSPPEGMKVFFNEESMSAVEAVIDGPEGTPYDGGAFRIRLEFDSDFPNSPPKGFFLTKIFHPNVSAKGSICVNTLKKDWKPDLGIKHVFITVRCLLIYPNPESALNEEAGKLLLERYEDYCKTAKLMTSIHAKKDRVHGAAAASGVAASSAVSSATSSSSTSPVISTKAEAPGADAENDAANKVNAARKKVVEKKKSLKRL
eukprot:TRINITY_DN32269_c0_g1_i1.p1 TRINITY_DN32269_c0_g1~~TRINITY_DN32269_c0_g1_i1.p1  ORF type:complete len:224 (+),score=101.71 TRINITY_DN32269_c0_g1_i1:164-835(+)